MTREESLKLYYKSSHYVRKRFDKFYIMSRSFHQRHRDSHHNKSPREILAIEKRNGVNRIIWRNRKIKPYGRKDFIGYGEETYLKKYGEYFAPVIDKKRERRRAKQQILIELSFD